MSSALYMNFEKLTRFRQIYHEVIPREFLMKDEYLLLMCIDEIIEVISDPSNILAFYEISDLIGAYYVLCYEYGINMRKLSPALVTKWSDVTTNGYVAIKSVVSCLRNREGSSIVDSLGKVSIFLSTAINEYKRPLVNFSFHDAFYLLVAMNCVKGYASMKKYDSNMLYELENVFHFRINEIDAFINRLHDRFNRVYGFKSHYDAVRRGEKLW